MVEIEDYIDPKCARHMMAFLYMETQGQWPESFKQQIKKDGVTFNNARWKSIITSKLAIEWTKTRLLSSEITNTLNGIDKGFGMPNSTYLKMQGVEIIRDE